MAIRRLQLNQELGPFMHRRIALFHLLPELLILQIIHFLGLFFFRLCVFIGQPSFSVLLLDLRANLFTNILFNHLRPLTHTTRITPQLIQHEQFMRLHGLPHIIIFNSVLETLERVQLPRQFQDHCECSTREQQSFRPSDVLDEFFGFHAVCCVGFLQFGQCVVDRPFGLAENIIEKFVIIAGGRGFFLISFLLQEAIENLVFLRFGESLRVEFCLETWFYTSCEKV